MSLTPLSDRYEDLVLNKRELLSENGIGFSCSYNCLVSNGFLSIFRLIADKKQLTWNECQELMQKFENEGKYKFCSSYDAGCYFQLPASLCNSKKRKMF